MEYAMEYAEQAKLELTKGHVPLAAVQMPLQEDHFIGSHILERDRLDLTRDMASGTCSNVLHCGSN